jgi:hypothetical protein
MRQNGGPTAIRVARGLHASFEHDRPFRLIHESIRHHHWAFPGCLRLLEKEPPGTALPDMSAVRTNLAFSCTHQADHLPPLDPGRGPVSLRALFAEAGRHEDFQRGGALLPDRAAHGHYKANQNLQSLISDGLAGSPDARRKR